MAKEHNSKMVKNSTLIDNTESRKYAASVDFWLVILHLRISSLLTKKLDLEILSMLTENKQHNRDAIATILILQHSQSDMSRNERNRKNNKSQITALQK